MKVNGKSKTPSTAAQSKKKNGETGGTKARASQQTSKKKQNGVQTAVLERISDGVLAFDAGLNYTYLNEPAGELLGLRAADLVGKNLQEQFPGEGRTPFMEACQRALETQSVVWLNEYFPPTGRWLEGRVYPSEDGVSVLFREAGAGSPEEQRARMLSMFPEQNPSPVMRLTQEAEVLYANQAAAPLLETWKRPDAPDGSFLKLRELLPRVVQSGTNLEIEIDHDDRVFLCQLVPIAGEGYVNLYFRDITERKRAEEALRALVNQPGAGICRTDLQGRFTFVNQVFCDMLGYIESELTGMSIWEITDKGMLEKNRRLFEHMVITGESYQLEIRLIRRNGPMIWVSVGTSPLRNPDGRIQGSTGVIVDITRRKRAEESLLDSARRSLFLSSLSDTLHSFNIPSKIRVEAACLLGAHLKASRVAYSQVSPDGRFLVHDHFADEVPEMKGEFFVADFVPRDLLPKFQSGRPVILPDVKNDPRFNDSQRSIHEKLSIRAQMILPITRDDRLISMLLIQQDRPRVWKEEEFSLVEEAAERMQAAIDRAQAEEKLRESEHKFNIIFHKLPFTALLLRPEDNVIVDINEEFETVFGYTRQEAIGRTTFELGIDSNPGDRAYILAELQANVAIRDMELQFHTKSHELRTFLINTDLVNIAGNTYILQTAQDITECRQAEREAQKARLQAEHEALQLRALLENLPVGVMVTDATGAPLMLNRALEEIWQGSRPMESLPDYVSYRAWSTETGELLGPADWPISLALQTGISQPPKEFKIERFDGTIGTMLSAAAPIRDHDRKVIRAVAVAQDITERKQIEQSLAHEREMFKRLFETMPVMSTIYEPETGTMRMNAEIERLTGWKQEEVTVASLLEALYPDPDYMKETLGRMAASVKTKEWVDVEIRTRDGRTLDTLWANISLMEGEKLITGISLGIDITERKRAEKALRASEEKYRRIVETANEGIWEINQDTRTVFANARMAEMLGYTVEEMLGRSSFEFVFPEDNADGEQRLARARRGTGARSSEFRYRRKDGSPLWTLVSSSPQLDEQGNFTGSIAMIMDISERKKAEQALRTSEERMRLAIESNRMVAWEWDPQADRVTTSENFAEIYGLPAVGNAAEGFALIWPDDLPAHQQKVDQVLHRGGEYRSEFRITRPVDGRTVWLEERAIALMGEAGQASRLVGVVIDITERKRAEQDLGEFARQQEALYKLADELSSAQSLDEMFNPALDAILSALQCDRASILLFDKQDVMSFVAWHGLSESYRRATNGHTPWTRAGKNARPISMEDVATADLSDSLRAVIQAEGIGALAFIPLISRGNLIGKFMVYFNQPHIFEEAEISLAQTIAHQLASQIERKQATEELRQSKQRLSLTYHHAPIGIVETTLDGRFLEVNDELCRMLGYTYDELIQFGIADITQKDDLEQEMKLYRQLAADEIPFYRMEKRFIRKDGTLLWGEVVRTMLHDEKGKAIYGIGAIINITERKQREEEIRARTEEIEVLMEVSPIGIFVAHDPECIHITGNPAGYHLVEMPEDSAQNISKSAPEHERPTYRTFRNGIELKPEELPMQAAARLGMEIEEETLELRFENGAQKYFYAYAKPLFDAQGRVRGAIAAMLDITERKRAEETLRQSEERFTRFMLHLPGLAWIKDTQGRYVFANAAAQKAFNVTQHELYGKTDQEIFPPETAIQFNRNDDRAIVEEGGVQVVETLPQVDGVTHHSLVTKFPIPGPDGRPSLIGGTAFDITERIQMEDALRVARAQAEKTAYRMTQLQKTTALLSQTITPSEIARMVVEQGISNVGAVGGSIMLFDEESQSMEMIYSTLPESVVRPFARLPLSMEVPIAEAARSGHPVWIASREEYLERYPHLAESISLWGLEAALVFPMIYKGKVLGTLSLSFSQPLLFSAEDQEYLLTLARQAAQAFERARVETAMRLDAAMVENVPAGVYLVRSSDGTILHTNPQLDKLFGYEPGEIVGKPVSVLNAESVLSPQEVADGIIDILRREGSWRGEILSKRKNGTTFWCYASVTTFEHDIHGTVWVAARQDITERKQIEEALGESEQRYRAIVSQATAGIVRKDERGRLLFVNQAFCDMLGMQESELTGRRIWELTHKEDVGENKRLFDRLMLEGIPFQFEKRLLHRNGSILWVNVSVSPVTDSTGKTHSAVSVYVDITRRRQAEGRLALLTTVSELAREFEDPDELMFAVAKVVGEHFQAKRTLFNEIDLENDREIIHRDYCRGVPSVAGVHRISAYSNITTAEMLAGKTVVNRDSKFDPRTAADYTRSYVRYGERAYVAVPLMREERWVASLWISDDQPRDWVKEDVDLLAGIAERTWTAAEKLRVDRALRDSEERLRVTFNTTVVGFATLQPDTRFMEVNDAYCRIVGYSRDELLQMSYGSLVHPRFSEETTQLLVQLMAGEVPSFTIEKIFVRRDGTEIWVQNSLSLVRDAEGTPLHLIAICQDVTERKRAEEELHQLNLELEERVKRRTIELQVANEFLRESEATSRLILESMPDAIVIIDRDGHIVHANTQVKTLFGYSPDELMGQSVESLVPQRFKTIHEQQRLSYGEQRNRRIMGLGQELFGRRKDESEFPVEVMLAPIDNSTNWDVLVAIRDNTRQRQAQEALRNNEEKLRTLFELLPVGVSFLNKDGRVSELNSALAEILDMPRSQILSGKYQSRRFIRADGTPMPPSEFASNRARLEQKTIYNVETGIVRENGEIIWTSVNAAPVQVADVEVAIVTIDITERKKAEEALHKNRERLRILSRRLVEVQEEERHAIARELHDRVGQNLAALTLNLNILRNQLSGETLDKVGTRLNDSVTLVNDILAITRSVMADLRPNVLDDYGLDAAISEYAERFTQRYGIRVITHTPLKPTPRLDPGVEMTLLRIAQEALTNIAKHAQASQAIMTLEMEEDVVIMMVEDNGQGILSWQKVNQPGSHGLRIMRERAEAFGGSLKIHSTYKNGTKIEVKIPLASSVPTNGRKEKK